MKAFVLALITVALIVGAAVAIDYVVPFSQSTVRERSYGWSSANFGAGTYYAAGFYDFNATDANLTQAATNQAYGTANIGYAAHAAIVPAAAGTVDAGTVGIRVHGTSVTDMGVITTNDSEVITNDITGVVADTYYETGKKWVGAVDFSLYGSGGSPVNFSIDVNYGFAKYDDLGNIDFTLTDVEVVGIAGANDTSFAVELLHHKSSGWTYAASGFVPGNGSIVASTENAPNDNLGNGLPFAWKRDNLSQLVSGADSEGFMFRITTGANNSVGGMDLHIGALAE